jgi:hypothetical protein
MSTELTPTQIRNLIYNIRGKAVMLDSDIAELYKVETARLNEAVKRNVKRFPEDFMFQLTEQEFDSLRSQIAISKQGRGGRRYMPFAFTEQGVAMLSGILSSDTAIDMNINIMRAFVQMRRIGLTVVDMKKKIDGLERKYDHQFKIVFDSLREILTPEPKNKRSLGFTPDKRKD